MALAAAGLLAVAFALLAFFSYKQTEAGVVQKHSQDQQLLAELAALALAQRADSALHSLEALAPEFRGVPREQWAATLAGLEVAQLETDVFLLFPDGSLRLRGPQPEESQDSLREAVSPWLGAWEPILTNPFPLAARERKVAVLVPLFRDGQPTAQLGAVMPFGSLLDALLARGITPEHMSLALIDEEGHVLMVSRHPAMAGRRVPQAGGGCVPCHSDFDLERRMVRGESGSGILQVASEFTSLVAYTQVTLPGRRWSLSLAEPYSAIIADTRQGFRAIVLLLGFVLVLGIIAVSLVLQHRARRRDAEARADLAERRAALERQMRHTEQLTAIGRMTSQIAHQINTPLASLGLNVAYLQTEVARRCGSSPEVEEASTAIAVEVDRLKRVVNDYLRFSRVPQSSLAVESLREVVEGCLDFVEAEARQCGVRVQANLGEETARVRLDPELFRQGFLNLVRNSFEAMTAGGVLRVELSQAGAEWVLRVSDTGRGVEPDVLPYIFDPFFTTKKDGTGLGLAHTQRVVAQHGGTIRCESSPGKGTTFDIRLPAVSVPLERVEEVSLAGKGR